MKHLYLLTRVHFLKLSAPFALASTHSAALAHHGIFKLIVACCVLLALVGKAAAQNTMVTYQGRLLDDGAPYSGTGQFKFALVTSTNFSHTATGTANLPSGGYITGYTVTVGGNGYVTAPAVTVLGGDGSGAAARAHVSGGVVISITVDNPGNGGYTVAPTVSVAPPPPNISYVTFWSNDGSSVSGSQPTAATSVTVSNGLFTVLLGDTTQPNMAAIPTSLFKQSDLQLRIWFDDGVHGSAALDPAQNLTPTPYAAYASVANTASNLVNGQIVQQNTNGAPNVIGGAPINFVSSGAVGATIAGGGTTNYFGHNYTNKVVGDFGTVSGGYANTAGQSATVGGGVANSATNDSSTVGGGYANTAGGGNATVAGGTFNYATGNDSTVAGGNNNAADHDASTVGGGFANRALGDYATVAGGYLGFATNFCATVGGGFVNIAGGNYSTVSGGAYNIAYDDYATVGGGRNNTSRANGTVGGGTNNHAYVEATVSGGTANSANGYRSTVGGGYNNFTGSDYATVVGGDSGNASALYSTVCGGHGNNASAISAFAAGYTAQAAHQGSFVWADYTAGSFSSAAANQFSVRATGGVRFVCNVAGTAGLQIAAGGSSWISVSDRNAKKNFVPVDHELILEKLVHIPIELWNYKWEADSDVPNIGPMAQDFKAAFYPGRDDKGISTLEFDGVELAAIQGLNAKVEATSQKAEGRIHQLEVKNWELKQQNDSLEKRLEALEQIIQKKSF